MIGDLRNPQDLDACFSKNRFDLVMHFAAYAYVGESMRQPHLYYKNNVVGTLNLLETMRRYDVKRLVFSSSCATYGEPKILPISESHVQVPINPYGRTKLMIEQALADYAMAYGFHSVSLRYFNAAGGDPQGRVGERHDPETHLIPLVLAEALRIKSGGEGRETRLVVFGNDFLTRDGSCVRDYIHVNDICRSHLISAKLLLSGKLSGAEYFNLANGAGFSVFEVIEACRRISGQSIEYRVSPRRAGDPAALIGDAQRAATILGWHPEFFSFEGIIETAWNWILANPLTE